MLATTLGTFTQRIARLRKAAAPPFAPITGDLPKFRKLRARLAKLVAPFLQDQAADLARQLARLLARHAKADLSPAQRAAIDALLAELDFQGWSTLADAIEDVIAEIAREAGTTALLQLNLDTETDAAKFNVVAEEAIVYSRTRSAAMVGMRRDALGALWPNPDARWQITESTREGIRGIVESAIADGWSNDRIADELRDSYQFSATRAVRIARTETQLATQTGALAGYRASGVVDGKKWQTAEDDRVSEECVANGEAGPKRDGVLLDLDATYPSGDASPPAHPNCRCALLPFIDWNKQPSVEPRQ